LSTQAKADAGKPGSSCPKGFLVSNTEFSERPICTASAEYQKAKLEQLQAECRPDAEKQQFADQVVLKTCLCEHLGNGALIALGVVKPSNSPQAICPGPNIAWFDRIYSLQEMVDHIYGRGESLVPAERPHMFAKEITMYVDYFERLLGTCKYTQREIATLREYKENLDRGISYCLELSESEPYEGENLASIPTCVLRERSRLDGLFEQFEHSIQALAA
jgi:hypothetical protein